MTFDAAALSRDLDALAKEHLERPQPGDVAHLRKMQRWTRALSLIGLATAWIAPNPLSILALSTGRFARFTLLAHHIGHGAYDRIDERPSAWSSTRFAHGMRRVIDWLDWMPMPAWQHEHNKLHHYRLGEVEDPDLVEVSAEFIRDSGLPKPVRYGAVGLAAVTWKALYYAPTVTRSLARHDTRDEQGQSDIAARAPFWHDWLPISRVGRAVWLRSYLPYIGLHFVLIPALFLLIGPWAWFSVLVNSLLAEVLTNLHAFVVIAPNHTGDDIYRFDGPGKGKAEFRLRQIIGSANYACGTDVIDFLHGGLNYQIEHHLFPRATLLQYRRIQPEVKALCAKHGVPYVQESVFKRARKCADVIAGETSMLRYEQSEARRSA